MTKVIKTMDGNQAAALASYSLTEVAAIFPITPSTPMAEDVDEWSAHGMKNIFGQPVRVSELQSEAGAAGALHGSLAAGALSTTYTSSQGLLLMIPDMYKMAGELLPAVFHVSARAISTHALSIFGDHQDVMACRQTGFALLASSNVQEAHDFAYTAHLCTIKSRIPFLHFFDGFRTSHEIQKIEVINEQDIIGIVDWQAIQAFRDRALSPEHPVVRGTNQNPDIYFQGREVANLYYQAVPDIVENYLQEIKRITGREYHLFDYYGSPDAEFIIVAMGSVCGTIEETIDYLMAKGEKVGVIKVRLYRPFSEKYFFQVLPKSVRKIAVLDRTKEPGAPAEPLCLDVVHMFSKSEIKPQIIGGRYGLGSKDTRPAQIMAVYDNLKQDQPKDGFTIGITDDVTHTSLPEGEPVKTNPEGTISCKFYGLGSDGTVGANKLAIKIIGDNTPLYAQGYFAYDSKKSGGTTISHLRFGKKPIKSTYWVFQADYIACHNKSFIYNYDLVKGLKPNGTFVLNCPWKPEELDRELPASLRRYIAENKINFHIIDAVKIACDIGLGGRINMIMQAAFFKLANVIPVDDAVNYLKESLAKTYGNKGQKIVDMNIAAVDRGIKSIQVVAIPQAWATAEAEDTPADDEPAFIKNIQRPMARNEGDDLPVSTFLGSEDGTFPMGTTAYEKRRIAVLIPEWQIDKCIQCNQCSLICPHATIRPFLLSDEELTKAPAAFRTKKPLAKGLKDFHYRIQIDPLDCTGCGNCADICPAPEKALIMQPAAPQTKAQAENWYFTCTVTEKNSLMDPKSVLGSQFRRPLFEFSGACPGCGETPYIKLITQLFGDRMMIANATGCSSIYGASAPSIPFTINTEGKGPAWASSLFEDNAEYGYGMYLGVKQIRDNLTNLVKQSLETPIPENLKVAFHEWLAGKDDGEASKAATAKVFAALGTMPESDKALVRAILAKKDYFIKRSQWMIGGDGWAYDIGYGGLDHVLASGDDINILVLDTEVYSNTGGQSSKSTPTAAVAKFAAAGKKIRKKDLGLMAMSYGYIYVAQIALGANMHQTVKALTEAENYQGPSLVIAYSPCISHGIKSGMGTSMAQAKKAVEAGYWHLYRHNPLLKEEGKNPFILDSKEPSGSFKDFILSEVRYAQLSSTFPDIADELFKVAEHHALERYQSYKRLTEMQY